MRCPPPVHNDSPIAAAPIAHICALPPSLASLPSSLPSAAARRRKGFRLVRSAVAYSLTRVAFKVRDVLLAAPPAAP